jgi:sulfur-carrier protein
VQVEGKTVGEALRRLVDRHAALQPHLYTDEGKLRSFVNLFLNDEDVRYLKQENTPVREGDTLSIIPSIAGGGPRTRAGSAKTRKGGLR